MTSASGAPPAGLVMVTCRALTSMLPDCPLTELDCSLITTVPALSGRTIVWFGAPVTMMGWPPLTEVIDRLASSELPDEGLPRCQVSVGDDMDGRVAINAFDFAIALAHSVCCLDECHVPRAPHVWVKGAAV